jgi:hypothetical protein
MAEGMGLEPISPKAPVFKSEVSVVGICCKLLLVNDNGSGYGFHCCHLLRQIGKN